MDFPDYNILLDAQTRAFIARSESFYPPEAASFPISRQRAVYDEMCRAFDCPPPPGMEARDLLIGAIPCRLYQPERRSGAEVQLVYLHGGGFVVGGLHSHDGICAEIADQTGLPLVAVDYRLAPEHPHPAALEDVLAVIRALPGPLLLIGDSAGGNLAAAACHRLRDPRLLGQVLIYPALGPERGAGSQLRHAHAPLLTRDDLQFYRAIRHGGQIPAGADPSAEPLCDEDFTALPPMLGFGAECDPLADDPFLYAAKIRAAGGRARAFTDRGLVHGWLRARHSVPRAEAAFHRITTAIARLARGEWPYPETEDEYPQQSET